MNREDRLAKKMARLAEMQKRTEERLDAQRKRVEARFERARTRLEQAQGQPSRAQQEIIEAALLLLERDGLANLSLRKLAAMLDMQAPALYWHFKNKEVLIDYMAEAILQREFKDFPPRKAEEPWQDWLVAAMQRLRKAMLAYPDGARVVAGAHLYPAFTLAKLFEVSLQSLTSAGLERRQASLTITTATHFVFGHVIEEQAAPSLEELKNLKVEELFKDYPLFTLDVEDSIDAYLRGDDEFEDSLRLIVGYAGA